MPFVKPLEHGKRLVGRKTVTPVGVPLQFGEVISQGRVFLFFLDGDADDFAGLAFHFFFDLLCFLPVENPEIAFGNINDRLLVGNQYSIPNKDGNQVVGILRDVAVNETDYSLHCIFELTDGKNVIVKDQLSEGEIAAYNAHPDTFFGIEKHQNRKIEDPISIYDFFMSHIVKLQKKDCLNL